MPFDEDDAFAPDEPVEPRRHGAVRQRPYLARRLVALVVGALFIVLLLLAVRGCLDARKERGFENYVRDLNSIASQSNQLSTAFFDRLEDPKGLTELSFKAEVSADRGTAQGLLDRVEGLDTPDELAGAEEELVKAFELRRDGLAGISDQISTALGDEGSGDAAKAIATYMRFFLASDVLYERARADIQRIAAEQGIVADEIPESVFLPDPPERWLDDTELATTLAGVAGDAGVSPGVHGLGLLSVEIDPGNIVPASGTAATISGGGPYEVVAQVQNQGESTESEVAVTLELTGGTETIEGETTIPKIDAGETADATIPIEPDPASGQELALEVTAVPVGGEQISDNNTLTFTVIFE